MQHKIVRHNEEGPHAQMHTCAPISSSLRFTRPELTFAFPPACLRSVSRQHDSWLDPAYRSAFEHDLRTSHEDVLGPFLLFTRCELRGHSCSLFAPDVSCFFMHMDKSK